MSEEDRAMLYIDKYVPVRLSDFKFNQSVAEKIQTLSKKDNFPHMIINGPSGSGKKTMANFFIQSKYTDRPAFTIKNQIYEVKSGNKQPMNVFVKYSPYHWQLNPSSTGVYDRIVIQELLLEIISCKTFNVSYNIIVIEDADKLSIDAQQCLRRMLEKFVDNSRFIFIVNNQSSLIDALVSRCVQFRLSAPTTDELFKCTSMVNVIENLSASDDVLKDICDKSDRNIKTAYNLLHISQIDEEDVVNKIVELILVPKIENIVTIRNHLYDLLVHCIDFIDILKTLYKKLLVSRVFTTTTTTTRCDNDNYSDKYLSLSDILVKYENSGRFGNKPIYHLEAFIVSVMNIIYD